jgi:Protein of unknown function (DUF2523)
MAFFFPALASAAGPIAKQVLASLGVGVITYAGLSLLVDNITASVQANYGMLPSSAAAIADLLGVGAAFGIILGAIVARVSYAAIGKIGKLSS